MNKVFVTGAVGLLERISLTGFCRVTSPSGAGTTPLPAKNHSENARKLLWASVREMLNIFKQLIAVATSSRYRTIFSRN